MKSTLLCLVILMWSRDRQFKFDPPWSNFGSKKFPKFTNFACLLSEQTLANHKSNDVFFTKLTFFFIKVLIFLSDSSYQMNNNFQHRVWFDRFEKVPILPNFRGFFLLCSRQDLWLICISQNSQRIVLKHYRKIFAGNSFSIFNIAYAKLTFS